MTWSKVTGGESSMSGSFTFKLIKLTHFLSILTLTSCYRHDIIKYWLDDVYILCMIMLICVAVVLGNGPEFILMYKKFALRNFAWNIFSLPHCLFANLRNMQLATCTHSVYDTLLIYVYIFWFYFTFKWTLDLIYIYIFIFLVPSLEYIFTMFLYSVYIVNFWYFFCADTLFSNVTYLLLYVTVCPLNNLLL